MKRLASGLGTWVFGAFLFFWVMQVFPFVKGIEPSGLDYAALVQALPPQIHYPEALYILSEQYRYPIKAGLLFQGLAMVCGLSLLLILRCGGRWEERHGHQMWRWPARALFALLIFLLIQLVRLPYRYAFYWHGVAFGQTLVPVWEWARIMALHSVVPGFLFVGKALLLVCCMALFGKRWWLAGFVMLFMVFSVLPEALSRKIPLQPVVKLSRLEGGPHGEAMRRLSARLEIPLEIYVEEQGLRSRMASLYHTGRAGRNFVVFSDTFLNRFPPEQAVMALAHEIGHLKTSLSALILFKGLEGLELLVALYLAYCAAGRSQVEAKDRLKRIPLIILVACLTHGIFLPVHNAVARWNERRADRYALRSGVSPEAYILLCVDLSVHNLKPLTMPWWEIAWMSRHPATLDRIRWIEDESRVRSGGG